ncbi:MAG: proline--tRNA ligase [Bacillales bacterium]|jgi:prolyl-tRNA synthetase|nr:proline--tRNA ligase [Bacillales bacterium]
MKASNLLIPTLKETPNEAVIPSHILLLRAGFMRKLVAGVYTYLPLGLKTLQNIENVIRKEMNKKGAQEILCSALQPKELWQESGRWEKYGPELMRLKDRHNREFCLGPTHEEIFTDLVRNEVKSKKQLPLNLYQIQTKYRDEMRPRFGLMRGREFLMKDSYSFDIDEKGLDKSYQDMYEAYSNIFDNLSLKYQVVEADTGAIGGNASHQFMALSETGESTIIYCNCGYAADQEKANSLSRSFEEGEKQLEIVETPQQKTIEDVSSYLKVPQSKIAKSLIYYSFALKEYIMVVLLGDREVNLIKLINHLDIAEHEIALASEQQIKELGLFNGFVGPKDLKIRVILDEEIIHSNNLVMGANIENKHFINANYQRDFEGEVVDIKLVEANHICSKCGQPLKQEKGIEVGQIFKLGKKYSKSMNCNYLDDDGLHPMVMGCYGIGVSRSLASIVEQHYDSNGISWPQQIAPYQVVIIPTIYEGLNKEYADKLYNKLNKEYHIETILDDRDSKPGFKFKDWELIGIPYQIIVGRGIGDGILEYKIREGLKKEEVRTDDILKRLMEDIRSAKEKPEKRRKKVLLGE